MSGVATPADGVAVSPSTSEIAVVPEPPEITVQEVVAALSRDTGTEADPGWSVHDPCFWDVCATLGDPGLSHPIDMVLYRGPHTRTITVYDAVVMPGRGKHRDAS